MKSKDKISATHIKIINITLGSVFKVTPRIIREFYEKKVHLNVNIQAG